MRALAALLLMGACAQAPAPSAEGPYLGVETALLDGDLVRFTVTMDERGNAETLSEYAHCAAAQYALIRDFGFARHVRTSIENRGSTVIGDAVYTISAALPRGLATIDAEVQLAECSELGIPTV
ncbi:MAG: hypothetical protein ACU0DW_12810 [Shimia sp.]